ncbi:FAD-dependent oxidoreductase [Salinisphaera sp. Q1T1-3]|uniref:FAD-dependent oxidoreductase n=1 Tax=Salinisphaera sp. Q1T1-3 TaxID=2321229 RepID=UPI000E75D862|nr:FAD-dependent oxidoreductase [Salinisphaera sp. Q1T1-3]RJS95137.1 hypothetical protein D3260_00845 [Salinisphaera sp. Q1T1-3]
MDGFDMTGISPARTDASVLIIGGGATAWAVADEIRRLDRERPLTLVSGDDGTQIRYAQPQNYLATAHAPGLALEHGHVDPQELGVTLHAHTRVLGLDRTGRRAMTTHAPIDYSAAVLATGHRARTAFRYEQPRCIQAATFSGARTLLERLDNRRLRHVAVYGHEGLACRVVELLSRSGVEVEWILATETPLETQLPAPLPRRILQALEHPNVVIHGARRIVRCQAVQRPVAISLDDGTALNVDHMIWADRVPGDARLAMAAGLRSTRRGVCVDTRGRTSDPAIYAIDACTATPKRFDLTDERMLRQEARVIASAICGHAPPLVGPQGWHLDLPGLPVAVHGGSLRGQGWQVARDDRRGTLLYQGPCERPAAMAATGRYCAAAHAGRLDPARAPLSWPARALA